MLDSMHQCQRWVYRLLRWAVLWCNEYIIMDLHLLYNCCYSTYVITNKAILLLFYALLCFLYTVIQLMTDMFKLQWSHSILQLLTLTPHVNLAIWLNRLEGVLIFFVFLILPNGYSNSSLTWYTCSCYCCLGITCQYLLLGSHFKSHWSIWTKFCVGQLHSGGLTGD